MTFKPTAQSGLAGSGCFEDVEVKVRCEEDEVVEEDWGRYEAQNRVIGVGIKIASVSNFNWAGKPLDMSTK